MFVYGALILLLLLACMGLAYEVRKRGEDLERQHVAHQQQLDELDALQQAELERLTQLHRDEVRRLRVSQEQRRQELQTVGQQAAPASAESTRALRQDMVELRDQQRSAARREWLASLADAAYRNEGEVDVKFISPLVRFLGYGMADFSLQASVDLRMGRQAVAGQVDWILWEPGSTQERQTPAAIIEVLAPETALDEAAQAQARSYAFGVGAPFYLLTNGQRFLLFRRDVRADQLVIDCNLADFANHWPQLYELLGVR